MVTLRTVVELTELPLIAQTELPLIAHTLRVSASTEGLAVAWTELPLIAFAPGPRTLPMRIPEHVSLEGSLRSQPFRASVPLNDL
jgi:hypothetical protein